MCLADRHKFVKDKKLCFNCFQSGHSSNACPSKFTCRECKMKHHTLLHRPQKQLPDQGTSTKTYSSIISTSNKKESTKQFTTGHFSAENEINTVLLSTRDVERRTVFISFSALKCPVVNCFVDSILLEVEFILE